MTDKPWTKPGLTAEARIGLIADHHMIFLRKSVIKDVAELLDAHARDAAPKWTPVSEGLPNDGEETLIYDGKYVTSANYWPVNPEYGEEETRPRWSDRQEYPIYPTHWIRLPEPPHEATHD